MYLFTILELELGEIFLEAFPFSVEGGVWDSVGVEVVDCWRYLLTLLELGPALSDADDLEADTPEAADVDE